MTNLAFVLVALLMWYRGQGVPLARGLAMILGLIGIGSGLFHTFATRWAMLADVLPILGFILVHVYAMNRQVLGWPVWAAVLGAAGFLPWAAVLSPLFALLPGFAISAFYWPVVALILTYTVALRRRVPGVARGLAIGAGLLTLSLTFRSVDGVVCDVWPIGTHFLWHILNAILLGWMIEVLIRHAQPRLAARQAGR